jgi:CDP-alcohol phosphatidyltransferase-like enzyme
MSSDELVRPARQLAVAVGDTALGVGRPAHGDPPVADRDVGVVVLDLGQLGEAVDERDGAGEVVERQLALEGAFPLAPSLGNAHDTEYGVWQRSRKQTPTRELVVEAFYRPLVHLVVLALLPLRVPPPAVVLANFAAGLAAAAAVVQGRYLLAAGLLMLKTVLDGADGALARASGRVTAAGRYLDSECDLAVNAALWVAVGYVTQRPLLAPAAFVVSTVVLSLNYNLRRLYRPEAGATSRIPDGGGVLRSIYRIVYEPQDRLIQHLVRRRRYRPSRRSLAVFHNLGLATQHTAVALCLVLAATH